MALIDFSVERSKVPGLLCLTIPGVRLEHWVLLSLSSSIAFYYSITLNQMQLPVNAKLQQNHYYKKSGQERILKINSAINTRLQLVLLLYCTVTMHSSYINDKIMRIFKTMVPCLILTVYFIHQLRQKEYNVTKLLTVISTG